MLIFKCIFISMFFLFAIQAEADFLNCDLKLELIRNSDSSETKQLYFEVEMDSFQSIAIVGSMNTVSCFGTTLDSFKSVSLRVKKEVVDGVVYIKIRDSSIKIGMYNYRFKLDFKQPPGVIEGKIMPLDNENFIHQNAHGTCRVSRISEGYLHFLRLSNYLSNIKEESVCH